MLQSGSELQSLSKYKSKVVSILLAIFWWQQIGWSYCADSRRFGLVAWRNTKKKVTLSRKRHPACGATVMCYGCYANGFWFESHLADFNFVLLFFRLCLGVTFMD